MIEDIVFVIAIVVIIVVIVVVVIAQHDNRAVGVTVVAPLGLDVRSMPCSRWHAACHLA